MKDIVNMSAPGCKWLSLHLEEGTQLMEKSFFASLLDLMCGPSEVCPILDLSLMLFRYI